MLQVCLSTEIIRQNKIQNEVSACAHIVVLKVYHSSENADCFVVVRVTTIHNCTRVISRCVDDNNYKD